MPDKSPHDVYPNLNERREILKKFRDEGIQIGTAIMGLDTAEIFVLIVFIKRSIDLAEGFIILLDDWNLTCAAPIIRVQLDNLLRLNYLSILDDSGEVSEELFSGKQFNKINDEDGRPLTDLCLRKYAEKEFPWIEDIYVNTSKFVHFSNRHIFASMIHIEEESHMVYTCVGSRSMHAKEDDLNAYYDVMIRISRGILKKLVEIREKKCALAPS